MSEQNKPFVVTDRRKFTLDGELRPDADPSPEREEPEPVAVEPAVKSEPPAATSQESAQMHDFPPPPTPEQTDQARQAYEMTADRLDTAIRAANPGMDHPPAMNLEQLIQSVYMTAIMQLGGATPEGQQPQVDIMGARQSVDMLGVLAEKTKGNLTPDETRLLDSALFELHMAFLEITQALARSAAAKAPATGRPGPVGPSIVR
ncbi:MAG: hypothetical protein JWP98_1604 [Edaphobacter sp.]|jgi:hypothetical protein|nr:hypothetical protein [Edaphobacter sp.]